MVAAADDEPSSPFRNTVIHRLEERVGFAHAVRLALPLVETDYVTVIQHDLAFVQEVDFVPLIQVRTPRERVHTHREHTPVPAAAVFGRIPVL